MSILISLGITSILTSRGYNEYSISLLAKYFIRFEAHGISANNYKQEREYA